MNKRIKRNNKKIKRLKISFDQVSFCVKCNQIASKHKRIIKKLESSASQWKFFVKNVFSTLWRHSVINTIFAAAKKKKRRINKPFFFSLFLFWFVNIDLLRSALIFIYSIVFLWKKYNRQMKIWSIFLFFGGNIYRERLPKLCDCVARKLVAAIIQFVIGVSCNFMKGYFVKLR